ncbi:CysB family HTH-type transcriptional regulator [Marichromatium gracile]|uniref:CysB family HTH-type transcriptional regulator n=1 Tax=Marichromatium gracile TaxID=1048 RepID=UPI001F342FCC|nr:CysB family HTH-type transcriptional regulator [Marichromatium gracile]MCF1182041.1 CysB family HTH-type transcriptional regulator [Marichromatium gracile]
MNLQQLRYVHEVARQGLSISAAAEALFTSQPGVSKQIRQLEQELGIEIFRRQGKRLVAVTEPGRHVLAIAARLLGELDNLRQVGAEYSSESAGSLTIATTHTQARYVLPPVIHAFMARYPDVRLSLRQVSPTRGCELVVAGEADLVIATEAVAETPELVSLPCYEWNRCVIAPLGHPILDTSPLSLEAIARWPLVTYDSAFTGRGLINRTFRARALEPRIVLTALDADVIKTYVRTGLGIGLIARMAHDPETDQGLGVADASHLFDTSLTRIGLRHKAWLRGYVHAFIECFAPHLTRRVIEHALSETGSAFSI